MPARLTGRFAAPVRFAFLTAPPAGFRLRSTLSVSVLAGGPTHLQILRQHRGRLLVNPGSVGMPFKEYVAGGPPQVLPFAEYAIVEADSSSVDVRLQRVGLDKEAVRRAVLAVDYPLAAFLAKAYV